MSRGFRFRARGLPFGFSRGFSIVVAPLAIDAAIGIVVAALAIFSFHKEGREIRFENVTVITNKVTASFELNVPARASFSFTAFRYCGIGIGSRLGRQDQLDRQMKLNRMQPKLAAARPDFKSPADADWDYWNAAHKEGSRSS
jgi:hypothetical protein